MPQAIRFGRSSPRLPKSRSYVADLIEREKRERYSEIRVSNADPTQGSVPEIFVRDVRYAVRGDHFYCHEINGPGVVYLRFNAEDQPAVRLYEGLTIQRDFTKLIFRFEGAQSNEFDGLSMALPRTEVLGFASFGPFIISRPPKEYGVNAGMLPGANCVATTTPRLLWADILALAILGTTRLLATFGKMGASVLIKNDDLANTLYVAYGRVGTTGLPVAPISPAFTPWYPIESGQTLAMRVDSKLSSRVFSSSPNDETAGILVATVAGEARYSFIISSGELDHRDSNNLGRV